MYNKKRGKTKVKKVVKIARKRKTIFLAKYVGTAKNIRLSGIGKIYIGKEFEVSEKIANALKLDEYFKVKTIYRYIEV